MEEIQSDWGQKGKKEGFTEDKYKGLSDEDAIKKSGVKIIPIAGEVEARNTEKRLTMTPEQRREQMLSETEDVAEDSKIYIYGASEEKTIKVDGKDVKVRTLPEGLDIVNGFYSPLEKFATIRAD